MTATSSVRYCRAAGDKVPLGVVGVLDSASPATPGGGSQEHQRHGRAHRRRSRRHVTSVASDAWMVKCRARGAVAALGALALLASAIPARRAAQVDSISTLKDD